MGASEKRKKEKSQDFKKVKLRVGKTPRKPDNFTSTAFRSKALVLNTQSIHSSAPSHSSQLLHHLSLLTHHAKTVRKESLAHLTTHLPTSPTPLSTATLIPKLAPLILDDSKGVRTQLLTLLETLDKAEVALHLRQMLLFVYSAMSHIQPDIRGDSTKFLRYSLGVSGAETMADGGWGKGLAALASVVAGGARETLNRGGKEVAGHFEVLGEFLAQGLEEGAKVEGEKRVVDGQWWAGEQSKRVGVKGFVYLGLFVEGVGEQGDDVAGRRRWCRGEGKEVWSRLEEAVGGLRKEGGETGRVASRLWTQLRAVSEEVV